MFGWLSRLPVLMGLMTLVSCTPTLNWRQVHEPALVLVAQFPCKPERFSAEGMGMLRCEAGGGSYVLAWRNLGEPGAVRDELSGFVDKLASRMHARAEGVPDAVLPVGAAAWPGSGRYLLQGAESPVLLQIWAQGTVLIHAQVLSRDEAAARQFMDSLRRMT